MSEEELEKLGLTKGELSTIIAKGLVNTFKDLANAKEGKIINIEEINELLKEKNKEIERLNNIIKADGRNYASLVREWKKQNNIINEFDDFITNVDSHINLGDESEEFILVRDKWLELQELKGVDKE